MVPLTDRNVDGMIIIDIAVFERVGLEDQFGLTEFAPSVAAADIAIATTAM